MTPPNNGEIAVDVYTGSTMCGNYKSLLSSLISRNRRFSQQPVGVNKLATLNKSMYTKAGLNGNFSNHSGKRTCATSLFHEGFDEQMISSRTGHRSTAIRDYKVPSNEQQFALSKILDPSTANMVSTVTLHDIDGDSEESRAKGVPGFTTIVRNFPELYISIYHLLVKSETI